MNEWINRHELLSPFAQFKFHSGVCRALTSKDALGLRAAGEELLLTTHTVPLWAVSYHQPTSMYYYYCSVGKRQYWERNHDEIIIIIRIFIRGINRTLWPGVERVIVIQLLRALSVALSHSLGGLFSFGQLLLALCSLDKKRLFPFHTFQAHFSSPSSIPLLRCLAKHVMGPTQANRKRLDLFSPMHTRQWTPDLINMRTPTLLISKSISSSYQSTTPDKNPWSYIPTEREYPNEGAHQVVSFVISHFPKYRRWRGHEQPGTSIKLRNFVSFPLLPTSLTAAWLHNCMHDADVLIMHVIQCPRVEWLVALPKYYTFSRMLVDYTNNMCETMTPDELCS